MILFVVLLTTALGSRVSERFEIARLGKVMLIAGVALGVLTGLVLDDVLRALIGLARPVRIVITALLVAPAASRSWSRGCIHVRAKGSRRSAPAVCADRDRLDSLSRSLGEPPASPRTSRILSCVEALLDNLTRVLKSGPPLRLAVLFGSHAKGRAHANSDVDVAILPRDPALSLKLELALSAQLSARVGREVDLVRLDRASTLVRWEIARDGIVLVAEPKQEWVRFRASTASEHADIKDALHRSAELFRRRLSRSAS